MHSTVPPPAQLTVNTLSSSESAFNKIFPFKTDVSSAAAPNIPISSSTVNTASIAGCLTLSSSKMAKAIATAIPSSPPRDVPFALM